eukprot:TRINITY_DN69392_c0_g1_i1.p1 TRINITY_DN69392_c0_g1~~TRINITY_DN69392_c0_g1_i1.p1  ORF type:complete len:199 (+),score=23.78 TRINITY_DN69392_c0_g1_i1:87-683(+)
MEVFEENFIDSDDEDSSDGLKGSRDLTVANSSTEDILVEIDDVTLIRETNKPSKHFAVGASVDGAKLEVGVGSTKFQTLQSGAHCHSIGPHGLWKLPVPCDIKAKGKSVNVQNSLNVRLYKIDSGGHRTPIGQSYIVGPGHGIIIFNNRGRLQVDQAWSRSWKRKFDPWVNNLGTSRDPHILLGKRRICTCCQFCQIK